MHNSINVINRTELNTDQYKDFLYLFTEAELQCWSDNLLLSQIIQSSAKLHQKTYIKCNQDDRGSFSKSINFGFKFKVKGGSAVKFNPILLMPGIFASGLWVVL